MTVRRYKTVGLSRDTEHEVKQTNWEDSQTIIYLNSQERTKIKNLCLTVALETSGLNTVIHSVLGSTSVDLVMQFLLDCSSLAAVIKLRQASGDEIMNRLFYLTRTWCYNMHRSRLTKLGLQQYI